MLANDAFFWTPTDLKDAVSLSWSASYGEYKKLYDHSVRTLMNIRHRIPAIPCGKIVEFGSGLGILDDLLPPDVSELALIDHTHKFLAERPMPLSDRCRFTLLSDIGTLPDGYFDLAISIRVFYHIDTITAIAIIRELGRLIRQGGFVVIQGFYENTKEMARKFAEMQRLTIKDPNYIIDLELIKETVLDYGLICVQQSEDVITFNKITS